MTKKEKEKITISYESVSCRICARRVDVYEYMWNNGECNQCKNKPKKGSLFNQYF